MTDFRLCFVFLIVGIVEIIAGAFPTHYMTEECNGDLGERVGGRLETSSSLTYDNLMDCYTSFSVASGKQIFMTFRRFDVEEPVSGACVDYLSVHDGGSTSDPLLLDQECDRIEDLWNLTSSGRHVTFYFLSDANAALRGFEVVYVAFSEPPCSGSDFHCDNDICIDDSLRCDDIDQCGDNSDEENCPSNNNNDDDNGLPLDVIIGCSVGGAVLLLILAVIIYKVYWYWYWKTWMKRNAWKKFPWEDDDNQGYQYPKTDKYQVYEIGKKGRREPDVAPYFAEEQKYEETLKAEDFTRYLDEM